MINSLGKVSLVINTKNEEKNITHCINSAKSFVDEVILVDMNSSDKTVIRAKNLGAKTYRVKNYGFVEPARNYAISKASSEWIFLLDADERSTPDLNKKLKKFASKNKYDVIFIPRKNIILKKWFRHTAWWPDYQPRFFKKKAIRWPDIIHAHPNIKGKIYTLPANSKNALIHNNYKNIDQLLKKVISYTNFARNFDLKKIRSLNEILLYIEGEFSFIFIESEGYKDGIHGFIMSKFMEFNRFLEVVRSWEKIKYSDIFAKQNLKNEYINRHPSQLIIEKLQTDLNKIQSSKFYKLWQFYCNIRDALFNRHV